jgi:diguanylate cyclase (GGDEF)-like protein/PAS domain S-box-containing protein
MVLPARTSEHQEKGLKEKPQPADTLHRERPVSQTVIDHGPLEGFLSTENFYRQILDSLADGVYFVDTERRITYWNRAAEVISGYSAEEVVGRCCRDNILVHTDTEGCQLCLDCCPLSGTFRDGLNRQAEVFLKHRNGHRVPVSIRVAPILDAEGRVIGGVEVFSENSSKLAALEKAAEMEQLALIDPLTGAGNRRYTERVLGEACDRYKRDGDNFALLFLDIDHFKAVNDKHGHEPGDAVLKAVSRTLANNLRSFDFLGRWGGDEFIIILTKADTGCTQSVAARCCALVRSCLVEWAGRNIRPTISIGAAMIEPGDSETVLIARADANLYKAKHAGRDQFRGP